MTISIKWRDEMGWDGMDGFGGILCTRTRRGEKGVDSGEREIEKITDDGDDDDDA